VNGRKHLAAEHAARGLKAVLHSNFVNLIREKANKRILFLPHAINQMNRAERMISTAEVRHVIFEGEIIEDYPEDVRGHSCLMLAFSPISDRPIHIVCTPKDEYLAIISAYVPTLDKWEPDYRTKHLTKSSLHI